MMTFFFEKSQDMFFNKYEACLDGGMADILSFF